MDLWCHRLRKSLAQKQPDLKQKLLLTQLCQMFLENKKILEQVFFLQLVLPRMTHPFLYVTTQWLAFQNLK